MPLMDCFSSFATLQVYIHGKVCIVDDRLAIIGSANINERSQRGDRDSEIATVIRDTDMIPGKMAGRPFQVGRFAHTLRKRLMREHLGVDVDAISEEDLMVHEPQEAGGQQEVWDPESQQQYGKEDGVTRLSKSHQRTPVGALVRDTKDALSQALYATGEAGSIEKHQLLHKIGLSKNTTGKATDAALQEERQMFTREGEEVPGFASAIVPTLEEKTVMEHRPPASEADGTPIADRTGEGDLSRSTSESAQDASLSQDGSKTQLVNDTPEDPRVDMELFGSPANAKTSSKSDNLPPHARVEDVDDADEQEQAAPRARSIIRKQLNSKFGKAWALPTPRPKVDSQGFDDPVCDEFWKNVWIASAVHNTEIFRKVFHAVPDDLVTTWKQYKEFVLHHERLNKPVRDGSTLEAVGRVPSETGDEDVPLEGKSAQLDEREDRSRPSDEDMNLGASSSEKDPKTRKPSRGIEGFERWERDEMEALLGQLNGHLVLYPTRFLEGEDAVNNFLFNADRLLPLPIYD
jgi:phospholipase D1/2